MNIEDTSLPDIYLIEPELLEDERGVFARWYCQKTFARHGLTGLYEQGNLSFSHDKGTLRGLHYQTGPAAEAKLVRCSQGSIFDVAVDCRENSPTRYRWFGTTLSANNRKALYIAEGFAHGYLTLEDESEVYYLSSKSYEPGYERGIQYDDPTLGIEWPIPPKNVSEKDTTWPPLNC